MNLTDKQIFQQRQSMPLETKIAMTKHRIKDFVDYCDSVGMDVYQSHSFGKDSTVLRHIIKSIGFDKSITPVFSNTGLEFKEIVRMARSYPGAVEVSPKKNFKRVWEEDGIPLASKKVAKMIRVLQEGKTEKNANMYKLYDEGVNSKGQNAPSWKIPNKWRKLVDNELGLKFTDKCCDHLKKEPLDTYQKKAKAGRIDAMMADEGGMRAGKHVCTIFDNKKPHASPMLFWTEYDVWEYINKYNVEVCEVYYDRIFDVCGNMVACDSPHVDLPMVKDSNVIDMTIVACDGADSGFFDDIGEWAAFRDDCSYDKEMYYYITGEKRTGCTFCGFGAHLEKGANRFQKLSVSDPRRHNVIINRMGMGKALEMINVKVDFCDE